MMKHCLRCDGALSADASRLILSGASVARAARVGRFRADAGHHRPGLSLAYAQRLIKPAPLAWRDRPPAENERGELGAAA
jgi:hypothetical protein